MKKSIVLPVLLLLSLTMLHAQSAGNISDIITTENATYGQAAYLAGVYQGSVNESASFTQAFDAFKQSGLIRENVNQDDKITLKDASFLFMQATGTKGGLFYTLFKNPRYAYRELKARKILPAYTDSDMFLSGRDAIALINDCARLSGGEE